MKDEVAAMYFNVLNDMNPGLVDAIRRCVQAGERPAVIASRSRAPDDSVLPGLIEGAATHIDNCIKDTRRRR